VVYVKYNRTLIGGRNQMVIEARYKVPQTLSSVECRGRMRTFTATVKKGGLDKLSQSAMVSVILIFSIVYFNMPTFQQLNFSAFQI